jgi:CDP-diacylglycerol--glycerol-3-phosphate 3-phosphatidyltransferase
MSSKIYPHDRLLAGSVLKLIPSRVTPNQITILRILLTPAVLWLLWIKSYETGIALFLLVAFTDMMDGSLARTRHQVTAWGQVWDPVADKLLIGSIAVLLLFRHFPEELAILIFGLEAAFLVGGYYRKRQGVIVSANWWGKFKMLCQVIGVTLFLLFLKTGMLWLAGASYIIFVLAALLAVGSLFKHGL